MKQREYRWKVFLAYLIVAGTVLGAVILAAFLGYLMPAVFGGSTQVTLVALISSFAVIAQRGKLRELKKTITHQDRLESPVDIELGKDPFVLYLRSFARDEDDYQPNNGLALDVIPTDPEMLLNDAIEPAMPVLAVGQPGESLPPLGAHRLYYSDDEWQDAVSQLTEHATIVIMRPGPSRAILWEIEHIVASGHLEKLVIYRPLQSDTSMEDYSLFRERVQPYLPHALPPDRVITGNFVAFRPSGKAFIVRSPVSAFRSWVVGLSPANQIYNELVPLLNRGLGGESLLPRMKLSKAVSLYFVILGIISLSVLVSALMTWFS